MHSWVFHPFYQVITNLDEAIRMTFGALHAMVSNLYFKYILNLITEMLLQITAIPFIMVGYLADQITRGTEFVKFLANFFWANIFGPIREALFATIMAIVAFAESSSVRWAVGKIQEVIVWLREVTATEWLTFFAIVFFWPLILAIYIVQSIISLFKMTDPIISISSVTFDHLLSLVSLTSPDDIDISKLITY